MFVDRLDTDSQRQFYQADLSRVARSLEPLLSGESRQQFRNELAAAPVSVSQFQKDVMRKLEKLDLAVDQEVQTLIGYSLDGLVTWCNCTVAVEVDGPTHFVDKRPNGATVLKRFLLQSWLVPLVSVAFWDWDRMTSKDRDDLLKDKQNTAVKTHQTYLKSLEEADLKYRLEAFGISSTGVKSDLVARLRAHIFTSKEIILSDPELSHRLRFG
jgi:hypothetical protein